MKIPKRNKFLVSIFLAIFVAVVVAFFWATSNDLIPSIFKFIQPKENTFAWWKVLILILFGIGIGFLAEKFNTEKFFSITTPFLVLWLVAGFFAARVFHFNLMHIPILAVFLLTFLAVHFRKLWEINLELSNRLLKVVSDGGILEATSADSRVENGFRLLETVLPLSEIIVFQYEEKKGLKSISRTRNGKKIESHLARQSSWQKIIQTCEEALKNNKTILKVDDANEKKASIVLPLISEDVKVGVLFVDIKQGFEKEDQYLLEAFSEQLARNFQRQSFKNKKLSPKYWINLFSTRALKKRHNLLTLINNIIKEQSFGVGAISYLKESHAIAYLDGTVGYINKHMRDLTRVKSTKTLDMNLFNLLDAFKTDVFNEPSIAVRRVLQTGKPYECELNFPKSNIILNLRISLVKIAEIDGNPSDTEQIKKPACFLVTVKDITPLKENSKLRSDMVNLMSHELRTPITSIQGFAEMLMLDESILEDSREYLGVIAKESQRASKILSNFLSVANLEQDDKQEFLASPVRINKVVTEVVENMQNIAKRKRIRLIEQQTGRIPPVSADKGLITKAVYSLVDNAIKYSPERTAVRISTLLEADFLRVEVEDRGYGIPVSEQEKIWQKFYRVARDGQDKEDESTGLGLSLVKEIVEQHKGNIELKSKVGFGSKFSIRIPRL